MNELLQMRFQKEMICGYIYGKTYSNLQLPQDSVSFLVIFKWSLTKRWRDRCNSCINMDLLENIHLLLNRDLFIKTFHTEEKSPMTKAGGFMNSAPLLYQLWISYTASSHKKKQISNTLYSLFIHIILISNFQLHEIHYSVLYISFSHKYMRPFLTFNKWP